MAENFNAYTIFMLAPQRHGSNKSQSLLSANHPDLYGPYPPVARQQFIDLETVLGHNLLDELTLNANLSPRSVRADGELLRPTDVEAELQSRHLPFNTFGIMTAIYLIGARSAGRKNARILCKSPDNLTIAERLGEQINDAVFVHVVRDPRAVWNSGRGTPRGPQTPHQAALQWSDYHKRATAIGQKHPLITVRYEDLMADTASELKRCCEFLEIPFITTMLEDHLSKDAQTAAKTNAGLWGNLDKPVLKDRAQAWCKELPDDEIAIIDNSCRATMEYFGYKPYYPEKQLTKSQKVFTPMITNKGVVEEPRHYQLIHIDHLRKTRNTNK